MKRLAIILLILMVPTFALAEETTEVRRACHRRNFYQMGGRYVLWHLQLCADYEQTTIVENGKNIRSVKYLDDTAEIIWTPHGLVKPLWDAKDCTAQVNTSSNGNIYVKGHCTIGFHVPLTAWTDKLDLIQRTVWDGFIIHSGGMEEYLYPHKVDFLNEDDLDPLPVEQTVESDADCKYYVTLPDRCLPPIDAVAGAEVGE